MTFSERIKAFSDIYKQTASVYHSELLIPDMVDDSYFEALKPKQKFYKCRKYIRVTEIKSSSFKKKMKKLIKLNVSRTPFLSYYKRKKNFVFANEQAVREELLQELSKEEDIREAEFNKKEEKIEKEKNREYEEEYKKEFSEYEQFVNPSEKLLDERFNEYYKKVVKQCGGTVISSGAVVRIDKSKNNKNLYSIRILVDTLDQFSTINPYSFARTASGDISRRLKSNKQIEEEYAQNICSLAFVYAVCLFNVCLDVKEVLTSCSIDYINPANGNKEVRYLYSVIIPRQLVQSFKMEHLNPVIALMSLEGHVDIRKEREVHFIEPLQWKNN